MQSWQILPIILVVGVFAVSFAMRKKLQGKAAEMYSDAMASLRTETATGKQPDESEPICFVATQRKMLSSKLYYVALTNRRIVLKLAGGETRIFDRHAVTMSIRAKTFADSGNMQTTFSRGWELKLALPDGQRHAWRVYDHAEGIADHGTHVQALVATLNAA